ncbi:hypothetical protein F406_gp120 [Agrobacterium phage 7-7-1]|uniref:Uncharacterized protein n=1 Tax=Agrobacterium phage 7-7-1 TaxID=1161931 RepID=J7FAS4_9CAUD|nr:hypothetical protein F406_gp120 [Agrobacterium phage 7-7-1]AFH19818.1 hypothetical protein 7-7-1_000120 [Agrobacterium phage 7-7-1]
MKTIYEFFTQHECTDFEKCKLVEKLAEIRYVKTLEMLKRILR